MTAVRVSTIWPRRRRERFFSMPCPSYREVGLVKWRSCLDASCRKDCVENTGWACVEDRLQSAGNDRFSREAGRTASPWKRHHSRGVV